MDQPFNYPWNWTKIALRAGEWCWGGEANMDERLRKEGYWGSWPLGRTEEERVHVILVSFFLTVIIVWCAFNIFDRYLGKNYTNTLIISMQSHSRHCLWGIQCFYWVEKYLIEGFSEYNTNLLQTMNERRRSERHISICPNLPNPFKGTLHQSPLLDIIPKHILVLINSQTSVSCHFLDQMSPFKMKTDEEQELSAT